ncbi:MAG: DsrE family protein [Thermoleophilaceae bacterium]|nr:DsrE family protein [Thermoleophilaceae bacterium]
MAERSPHVKYLFILNDPPYGTERSYNGLRLAMTLLTHVPDIGITVFLMGDAVACAKAGQKTPDGYYNLERMLKPIVRKGDVLLCGTCMDARAMTEAEMVEGTRRSSMSELAACTADADKVLVF